MYNIQNKFFCDIQMIQNNKIGKNCKNVIKFEILFHVNLS